MSWTGTFRRGMQSVVFILLLSIDSASCNAFRGTVIRCAGYHARPAMGMIKQPDGNTSYYGYNKDFMDIFFNYLGMKYVIVNVNETEVALQGMAQTMLDQLRRNEVDFNPYGFIATVERLREFDFTIPVFTDQFRFLVKYPEEESRLWGPVRPFQLPVWVLFLVSLVAVDLSLSSLMLCVAKLRLQTGERRTTFTELVLNNAVYICTIIVSQAEYVRERKLSVRILVAVWCLMALTLINSYTGNLISYLTVPKLSPIVNSFDELANQRSGLVIEAKSILAGRFMNATTGTYKVIGDAIRANPKLLVNIPDETGTLIRKYNVPYLGMNLIVQFSIGVHLKEPRCRYTQSKLLPLFQSLSVILRKDSPYTDLINNKLHYMLENGLMEKLRQNYRPRIDKCLISNKTSRPKTTPLKLVDIYCAFVILGIGLVLAVLTLLAELIASHFTFSD